MRPDVLCTLEAAKLGLGLAPSASGDDTRISLLIEAATDVIERAAGRKFVRRNYNDGDAAATPTYHTTTQVPDEPRLLIDGNRQTSVILPNFPVVDDSGFIFESLATRAAAGDTWTVLVKNEDYILDRVRGMIRVNGGYLSKGIRNYRVTYEAGFLLHDKAPWVPADLQEMCVQLVREGMQDNSRVTSEKIGEWSRSYDVNKANPFLEAVQNKYATDSNFL